jgi:Tol biopolymer transport system component/C-terminal processing protease CtpA/Prc
MLVFTFSSSFTRRWRVAAACAAAFLAFANLGIAADPRSEAPSAPLWMRYPAISPDGKTIAFSFEGHLFTVPVTGGTAQALTAGPAHDTSPVWSPDGKFIAFASDRYGHYDVFLLSIDGGPARRLTAYSSDHLPTSFTPDGKYVLANAWRQPSVKSTLFPTRRLPQLYKISIEGGLAPEMLLTMPGLHAVFDQAGQRLLYEDQKAYEDIWRKHNTTSFAHDVWLYDPKTGNHTKLTNFPGEDRNPVWSTDEGSVYYLSEQSGSFNVWKFTLNGTQPGTPQQITQFERNPVRFLSIAHDGTLCYGFNGEIYTQANDQAAPTKLNVKITVADSSAKEQVARWSDGATEVAVNPDGKELAFVLRGDIFVTSIDHGETKRVTNSPAQKRSVSFSKDGRKLLFAAEENARWNIYEASIVASKELEPYFYASTVIDVRPILVDDQEKLLPTYSPDGKDVAYLENRTTLKVFNLETKQSRVILPGKYNYSYEDGDQWYQWSPDGKWFLVKFLQPGRWSSEAGLVDSEGKQQLTNLTNSGFEDVHPVWAQEGKSMIWLTDEFGLRGTGSGGEPQVDIIQGFFTQQSLDRFELSPAEFAIVKAREDEEKKKKESEKKEATQSSPKSTPTPAAGASVSPGATVAASPGSNPSPSGTPEVPKNIEPLKIELQNFEDRERRLTLASGKIEAFALTKDGETLLYAARADKGLDIWSLKPREKELKRLGQVEAPEVEGIGVQFPISLILDQQDKNAYILANGRVNKIDLASGKMEPVRFAAEKDLNPAAERAYIFEHMWRLEKEKFWVTDMGGVDWDYYKGVYERFLPFITDNRDFAEMMSEMLGELNASHTGCRYFPSGGDQTAALGLFVDPTYTGTGLKIAEVIEKGPLTRAGREISAGMVIEKIDGQVIAPGMDVSPWLNFKAGKPTALAIFDPAKNERFDVTTKPVGLGTLDELLYERWAKTRRELVDRLSHGTIGYVHVRSMNDPSYRQTFKEALGREATKKALIIDTRFNNGGNLHDELETFLDGKRYLQIRPRGQDLGWEPNDKWSRSSVVLANEGNYSDGMLFPWLYQHLKLGKVIGMQVPGTGTAVWWEFQQDPTLVFGIPQVGFYDEQGEAMENTPVNPDIEVRNDPKSVTDGRDLQIERAVKELKVPSDLTSQ